MPNLLDEPKLTHNERLKALSSFFHSLAAGILLGGLFIPIFAANLTKDPNLGYILTGPVSMLLSASLVAMGQLLLGFLRE